MNHHLKRILIMFSVALNIGFIITAIVLYYTHPPRPHHRYRAYAQEALQRLNLPPEQHKDVTMYMDLFKEQIDATMQALHLARTDMLMVVSNAGPLDQKKFDETNAALNLLAEQKNQEIRHHVLRMRKQLGDDKGAQFFSEMLTKVKTDKRHP